MSFLKGLFATCICACLFSASANAARCVALDDEICLDQNGSSTLHGLLNTQPVRINIQVYAERIDSIQIIVADKVFTVPSSAYSDLIQPWTASIKHQGDTDTLYLHGADAGAAYIAEIVFNAKEVLKRKVSNAEMKVPLEETTYFHALPME